MSTPWIASISSAENSTPTSRIFRSFVLNRQRAASVMQGGTHTLNFRNSFLNFVSSIFSIPEPELYKFQELKLKMNFKNAFKLETFLRLRFGLSSVAERFSTLRAILLPSSMISIEFSAVPAEENENSR